MRSPFHKSEEVILEKYLKLSVFECIDGRCAWLICDECDLSEKRTRTKIGEDFTSLGYLYSTTIHEVGTSIRSISYSDDTFSFFSILCLTHEEKK